MRIAVALLPALLFGTPVIAYADGYSKANQKQSRCESAGELAQSFYGADTKALRSKAADIEKQVAAKQMSKILGEETKYILFLGKTAKSPKEAYMNAWAWCMDQK